jgi:hypothetical protein
MIGWLALAINTIGLVLIGMKIRTGWLFGIAAEALWIAVATEKQILPLAIMSGLYITIAIINWNNWRQDERTHL